MSFTFPNTDHTSPRVKIVNASLTDTSLCYQESMVPMERNVETDGGGNEVSTTNRFTTHLGVPL